MVANTSLPTAARFSITNSYDSRGRRIQKSVGLWNGSAYALQYTRRFLYDGWNVIAELDGSNTLIRSYIWGNDLSGSMQGAGGVGGLLVVKPASGDPLFVSYDGNGNVVGLLDGATGTAVAQYAYGPFGEVIELTPGTSGNPCPFRFSTKYDDDESDLLYYGYRFYNPGTGRWLSRDPIGERGGFNIYSLVRNNAINLVDYAGLCGPCCVSDFDLVTSGKLQGGKTILDYYPGLKGDRSVPKDPGTAGVYNNGRYLGANVQMVSKISGSGADCNFTQTFFAKKDILAGITDQDQGKTVDDLKKSKQDQSKPPFRQYLDGNPSMADMPCATAALNTYQDMTFTTCLLSGGSGSSQSCKYKKCCVEWHFVITVKPSLSEDPTVTVMKVKKWCE